MNFFKSWWILFGLQALISLVVFSPFLSGQAYFAYVDIGSDSYAQVLPDAMHMARKLAAEGFTGWSFEFGLGGPTALLVGDSFSLLTMLLGPDNVLPLRIWVYLLKIALGGAFFLAMVRCFVTRWESAVITALAYSFCGFVVINGQWDLEATEFVFFPLIIWAVTKTVRHGNVFVLPIVIAATLASSVFFVSVGVFMVFTGLAFIAASQEPRAMLQSWLVRILPLTALGFLLAAPRLLPIVLQIMDSSRVSGGDALFAKIASESLSINGWSLISAQIGGLFHKDIFGIGNAYQGHWNYLEGPGFYIGITLFLLIPQLWSSVHANRKILLIGIASVTAYFVFPFFRNAAMGFAVPYFRVSTLWVSLILLLLAAKAVDHVINEGVNPRLVLAGMAGIALLLLLVIQADPNISFANTHVHKVLAIVAFASVLLLLVARRILALRLLPLLLLMMVAIEAVLIARPSYVEGRLLVTPAIHAKAYNDGTLEALQVVRALDKSFFRIEKTYNSVSLADSRAQDYAGVKSYHLHSRGLVDFFVGLGLIPAPSSSTGVNYTNWLPDAGPRYMLNSLLGVKYIIAKQSLTWPGLVETARNSNFVIYRNALALPLGVVQTRQITEKTLQLTALLDTASSNTVRDVGIINAAVVKSVLIGHGTEVTQADLLRQATTSIDEQFVTPAKALQVSGLKIESFSSNRITGNLNHTEPGILVFSIPFSQGWTLKIDGVSTPLIRANFGMLAAPVNANAKKVELDFLLPGQRTGIFTALVAFVVFVLSGLWHRRNTRRLQPKEKLIQ